MKRILTFTLLILVLALPVIVAFYAMKKDNVVTSRYATYHDAAQDHLFERGWLPNFIPQSSRSILTHNDLDLNTSWGTFDCAPADLAAFTPQLAPYEKGRPALVDFDKRVARREKSGYRALQYIELDHAKQINVWVFLIDAPAGHVEYFSWTVQKGT